MLDPTERFSSRAGPYAKYRPDYPPRLIEVVSGHCGLSAGDLVADVGSGTGKLSRLLLDHGYRVIGVEPNAEMRRVAERLLGDRPSFLSVNGRAELTTIEDRSVDLVTAAQAFHWFDPEPARLEFARILRPGGHVAVIWNARRVSGSALMGDYEALLRDHGEDPGRVRPHALDDAARQSLFGSDRGRLLVLHHHQSLTYEGLRGRVASVSYMPAEGEAGHAAMMRALRALFETHQREGRVRLDYDTRIYCGTIRNGTP